MLHALEGHVFRPSAVDPNKPIPPSMRFECRCGEYTYNSLEALTANQRAVTRRFLLGIGSILLLAVLIVVLASLVPRR